MKAKISFFCIFFFIFIFKPILILEKNIQNINLCEYCITKPSFVKNWKTSYKMWIETYKIDDVRMRQQCFNNVSRMLYVFCFLKHWCSKGWWLIWRLDNRLECRYGWRTGTQISLDGTMFEMLNNWFVVTSSLTLKISRKSYTCATNLLTLTPKRKTS